MDSNLLAFATTVPFVVWYVYKFHMLSQLEYMPGKTTAAVINKLGRTIRYQFTDADGKLRRRQCTLPADMAGGIGVGDTLAIIYLKHDPRFNCPARLLESTLQTTRLLRNTSIAFAVLLALPLLAHT